MAKPKRRRVNRPATVRKLVEDNIDLARIWSKDIKRATSEYKNASLAEYYGEALFALFMAARQWKEDSDFRTYAKISIRREVCRLARAARFPTRKTARYFDPESATGDPEVLSLNGLGSPIGDYSTGLDPSAFSDKVQAAIKLLRPLEWIAFRLMAGIYGHRQPIRQTAGIMGLSILEVDALYNRAVEKMKRALTEV